MGRGGWVYGLMGGWVVEWMDALMGRWSWTVGWGGGWWMDGWVV